MARSAVDIIRSVFLFMQFIVNTYLDLMKIFLISWG